MFLLKFYNPFYIRNFQFIKVNYFIVVSCFVYNMLRENVDIYLTFSNLFVELLLLLLRIDCI